MKRSQAEWPRTGPSFRALERNQFCQYLDNMFFKVTQFGVFSYRNLGKNTETSLNYQCSKIRSYEILLYFFVISLLIWKYMTFTLRVFFFFFLMFLISCYPQFSVVFFFLKFMFTSELKFLI